MQRKILVVAGTRPEIVKVSPVIEAFRRRKDSELRFVWTGQHYDRELSTVFLEDLEMPKPDSDLGVGPCSPAEQSAKIALGLEKEIERERPDVILAEGDTNTVAETALAARRGHIPFGHVEAGLRSYDRCMPEEINRCVAGICADLNFAPTSNSALNLIYEGISPSRIFVTGNTIVDVVATIERRGGFRDMEGRFGFDSSKRNILATIHRAENVDNPRRLGEIVSTMSALSSIGHVVFPIHPRTVKNLSRFDLRGKLERSGIEMVEPMGYLDFLSLERACDLIVTDSGGVQEEGMILGTPVITMRYNTERPETVWEGNNAVLGTTFSPEAVRKMLRDGRKRSPLNIPNALGDGDAGARIAEITISQLEKGIVQFSPDYRESGGAIRQIIRARATLKVSEIEKATDDVKILVIYDSFGNPILPDPDYELSQGQMALVFGTRESIGAIRDLAAVSQMVA